MQKKSYFHGNVNSFWKGITMTGMKSVLFLSFAAAVLLFIGGCGDQRNAPQMQFGRFDVETTLTRDHIVVMERVEGISETDSILLGTVQVIDGNKVKVLGIPFFKDKYTCLRSDPLACSVAPKTQERAYYKALEATPEADAVFYKSWNRETGGIPLIWDTEKVTFSGKAFSVKPDEPQSIHEPDADSESENVSK
ncbi:MAG: hypothetical protein JXM79_17480 [Sedimentisphaerales bacterium]|nr:hypothetical protein [Sedimentisphaerales bacterium]